MRESMDKNRVQGASVGRAGHLPRSPYPSRTRSVDPATVRGRRLSLPQEICSVSLRRLSMPQGILTALRVFGQLCNTADSGRGPWYIARSKALSLGLSNAHFKSLGLPSLIDAR